MARALQVVPRRASWTWRRSGASSRRAERAARQRGEQLGKRDRRLRAAHRRHRRHGLVGRIAVRDCRRLAEPRRPKQRSICPARSPRRPMKPPPTCSRWRARPSRLTSSVSEIARQVHRVEQDRVRSGHAGGEDRRAHHGAVAGGEPHRRRGQADHGDRRADQPARAQRHDRGGARRRSRPRLRGGGFRGEAARVADRQGDRRDLARRSPACRPRPQSSVAAIKEIGGTIGRISDIASTIAAAVEEQSATTQEISRNVHGASQGTTRGRQEHRRRQRGGERDRLGLEPGALLGEVAVARRQRAQGRGRGVPAEGPRGLTEWRATARTIACRSGA